MSERPSSKLGLGERLKQLGSDWLKTLKSLPERLVRPAPVPVPVPAGGRRPAR